MGYTAMRGGLEAIERAEELVRSLQPGHAPDLSAPQVRDHLRGAVDRVMSEGGLYDRDLAALAVRQAEGDMHEATLLLRAYRSTLPRLGYSEPPAADEMEVVRRITPAFKSTPGGHVLGRTRDYSQRLLDFSLMKSRSSGSPLAPGIEENPSLISGDRGRNGAQPGEAPRFERLVDLLRAAGLADDAPADDDTPPEDITRDPLRFPASRSARLQALARGETGAMTALAYSTMRGHGAVHSALAELRVGFLPLRVRHPYTGGPVTVGEVEVTEVEEMTLSKHTGVGAQETSRFGVGYGLIFGENERKAIAMALLDRTIESGANVPAADEEFVLYNIDGVEASGFVEHLKLPHYVEFQALTQRMRALQERLADGLDGIGEAQRPGKVVLAGATSAGADHAELHALGVEHDH
jgi:alpha-D-ribose 1-methylphosphonate 5-triphosphate synthase subunit PhnI